MNESRPNDACRVLRTPVGISDSLAGQWQLLLERSRAASCRQGPAWFRSCQAGTGHFAIITATDGRPGAVSVVRERRMPLLAKTKYFIDGGPVAADRESLVLHLRQVRQLLEESALWVRAAPCVTGEDRAGYEAWLAQAGYQPRERSMGYAATVTVDLQPPLAQIRRQFRRSLKTQLNKSERMGIDVRAATSWDDFAAFMRDLNIAKGNPPGVDFAGMDGAALYRNFIENPEQGICLVARLDGQVLAGILVLAAGERAIYQWGYSNRTEARRAPLSHCLHWEALQWARDRGFRIYDFGGYWPKRGDADPINRFKTGFSRQIDEVCGEFQLTLAPLASAIASSAEQVRTKMTGLMYLASSKRAGARVQGA